MNANSLLRAPSLLAMMPILGMAQVAPNSDPVVLKHWAAPLYWQPRAAGAGSQALDPNPLVFVAMTPCRVVDTRASQGFPAALGPPSLVAGASRTFPVQSSASCPIPAAAQAYSFNVTVVPAGPSGFITAYPTGQPLPLAATLVWSGGALTSNAAVVPAGTNGSIDVYANVATDIVIDINGYYAPGNFGTNTNQAAAGNGATCTLGEIILSAGSVANGTPANGQILSIAQNTALFSLLGTLYGGNGTTTFALPDLRAAAPNGLTYSICDQGFFQAGAPESVPNRGWGASQRLSCSPVVSAQRLFQKPVQLAPMCSLNRPVTPPGSTTAAPPSRRDVSGWTGPGAGSNV